MKSFTKLVLESDDVENFFNMIIGPDIKKPGGVQIWLCYAIDAIPASIVQATASDKFTIDQCNNGPNWLQFLTTWIKTNSNFRTANFGPGGNYVLHRSSQFNIPDTVLYNIQSWDGTVHTQTNWSVIVGPLWTDDNMQKLLDSI